MKTWRPIIIMITLNLLALGFWGGAGYLLESRRVALAPLVSEYEALRSGSDRAFVLERGLAEVASARQELLAQFVTRESLVGFLEDLDRYGAVTGVTLKITDVTDAEPISLQLRATGPLRSVYHFLQLIEQAPYQLRVNNASFGHGGEFEKQSTWALDLSLDLLKAQP